MERAPEHICEQARPVEAQAPPGGGQATQARAGSHEAVLALQRRVGNAGVQKLMRSKLQLTYFDEATVTELISFWKSKLAALGSSRYSADNKQRRANRYRRYIRNLQTGQRPEPHQSQAEVEYLRRSIGGRGERPFKHGRADPRRTQGSTAADFHDTAVLGEVKNYGLTPKGETKLVAEIKRQVTARRSHGPYDIRQQAIVIDARGQGVPPERLEALTERIARATGVPAENIEVLAYPADAPPPTVNKPAAAKGKAAAVKGTAGGILSLAFGPIQGAIAQAAMDKRVADARATTGYAAYGSEYADPDESRLFAAARYLMNPWGGEAYSVSDRFDITRWRRALRAELDRRRPGGTFEIVWEVQVGMKGGLWLDEVPDIKRVKVVYRKMAGGWWMDEPSQSDRWPPKARMKQPPNLNYLISPERDDNWVESYLQLSSSGLPADKA